MRKATLKTFRIVVGGLGILSIVLMVYIVFFNPISGERNSIREYVFLCFGLPVLMLNFFAWFTPDLVQSYFSKKKKDDGE